MAILINRERLITAFSQAARFTATGDTTISGVKLETEVRKEKTYLVMSSTNTEAGLQARVQVEQTTDKAFLPIVVPTKSRFTDLMKTSDEKELTLETIDEDGVTKETKTELVDNPQYKTGSKEPKRIKQEVTIETPSAWRILRVKAGKTTNNIKTLRIAVDDFPAMPATLEAGVSFEIKSVQLRNAINMVVPCAAPNAKRPELNAVLFHAKTTKAAGITLVAGDGFRMGIKRIEINAENVPDLRALIPLRSVQRLVGDLPDSDLMVTVRLNTQTLQVETESWMITCLAMDKQFPDYTQIIPRVEFPYAGVLKTSDIATEMRRISAITRNGDRIVSMNMDDGKLKLHTRVPESVEYRSMVNVEGTWRPVAFNAYFLESILKSIWTDNIRFDLPDVNVGGLATIRAFGDKSILFLVAPVLNDNADDQTASAEESINAAVEV